MRYLIAGGGRHHFVAAHVAFSTLSDFGNILSRTSLSHDIVTLPGATSTAPFLFSTTFTELYDFTIPRASDIVSSQEGTYHSYIISTDFMVSDVDNAPQYVSLPPHSFVCSHNTTLHFNITETVACDGVQVLVR